MRAENKQKLKEQFIRVAISGVPGEAILTTDLAKLAGPVGQHGGSSAVCEGGIRSAAGTVVAATNRPPPVQAVVRSRVKTERPLDGGRLLAFAPDEFRAREKIVVNRAA